MNRAKPAALALFATVLAAGCATPEYRAKSAEADLRKLGYTASEAHCVVTQLHDYYATQYVNLQIAHTSTSVPTSRAQLIAQINPKEVDLYVRNKFAGQDRAHNDELTAAKRIVASCRG